MATTKYMYMAIVRKFKKILFNKLLNMWLYYMHILTKLENKFIYVLYAYLQS